MKIIIFSLYIFIIALSIYADPNFPTSIVQTDRYGRWTAIDDSSVVWDEIVVRANSVRVNPINTKPDYDTFLFPGKTYLYDSAAAESTYFNFEINHAQKMKSPLYVNLHWCPINNNTGKVAWKLVYMIAPINGVFSFSAGDTLSVQQAGSGIAFTHQYISLGVIPTTSINSISAVVFCILIRDANLGSDSYNTDAALIDIGFHYQKDSNGSRYESLK